VTREQRKTERHRVHLSVRYASASEFVAEYARNLSHGGLFISDACHLEPLAEVKVELTLPGAGSFTLTCQVAHVVTVEMVAAGKGSAAGAGVAIQRAPKGFKDALASYLQRLGRRADVAVFVGDELCAMALAEAGYRVHVAPPPAEFAEAFAHSEVQVIAVVVPRAQALVYQQAAAAGGAGEIVVEMDDPAELDEVLVRLDEEL